ncbi:MAG: hypothetical protein Q9164_005910 [Protoblastenia rupestris]
MAEIAGLAVGIVPIVLCAVKGHMKLSRGLSHVRNFSREVNKFTTKLDHQKLLFNALCEELLSEIVDQQDAAAMIASDIHPFWSSKIIEDNVIKLLGSNCEIWTRMIGLIDEKLSELNSRREDLVGVLKSEKRKSKETYRNPEQWIMDFSKKAKRSLQRNNLEQSLGELKDLVECLNSIYSRTIKTSRPEEKSRKVQLTRDVSQIRSYGPTRQASQEVYNVLSDAGACNQHLEHRANLCVEVKESPYSTCSEFRFTLTLEHPDTGKEPLWFEVKTEMDQVITPDAQDPTLCRKNQAEKRKNPNGQDQPSEKKKRCRQVTMQLKPTVISGDQHHPHRSVLSISEVRINGNICDFLGRWCPLRGEAAQRIGILPGASCWKCTVSPARAPAQQLSLHPMSLRKLISVISKEDDLRIFLIGDRIRLARLLTTALLRYYSTEWGRACCESDSIQFFDINKDEPLKPIKLTYPHLAARIRGQNGKCTVQAGDYELKPVKGAPNTAFFYFAILLLQIAHAKDWARLQEENPLRADLYGEYAEYDRVLTLARRHNSGLPSRYHRAIENLLQCKTHGSEAIDEQLQEAVHQDVVMPLEELEKLSLED